MERHLQNMKALQKELEEIEERTRQLIREGKRLLAEAEGGTSPQATPARRAKRKTSKRAQR